MPAHLHMVVLLADQPDAGSTARLHVVPETGTAGSFLHERRRRPALSPLAGRRVRRGDEGSEIHRISSACPTRKPIRGKALL